MTAPLDLDALEVKARSEITDPEIVAELIRRLREAEADAARYRWLRNESLGFDQVGTFSPYVVTGQLVTPLETDELDFAIDAAMAKEK